MPVAPPPTAWRFPSPLLARGEVVAVGGDVEPGTMLAGYSAGMLPMRLHGLRGPLVWWSPDPRGVLPVATFRAGRSLRRSMRRYDVRVDTAFEHVVAGCADRRRPGGWITREFARSYAELHRLGWAHSIETWEGDRLVGGLLGVAMGGFFSADSKFSLETDASKVAVAALVDLVREGGQVPLRLIDVQWPTNHLRSVGCVEMPRPAYLSALAVALSLSLPPAFTERPLSPGEPYSGGSFAR